MGCGCKKKNNEPEQPVQNQTESTTTPVATPDVQQEQIVQVAVALREMIQNKEL